MRVIEEHVRHPDRSLRFIRFEVDAFRAERHRHRQLELTWIERGAGLRFVGDSVAPFGSGDLVLLGVNVPHAWVSATSGEPSTSVASVLQFPPAVLEQAPFPELRAVRPLAQQANRGLQIRGAAAQAVCALLASLPDEDRFERLAALVRILGVLTRHPRDLTPIAATGTHRSATTLSARRVDVVAEWVAREFGGRLDVRRAARLAHVSPGAFSRFFRRETGKSFTVYVNDVRCGEACVMLRQSGKPVSVIAEECGFASISHFNRQFRERLGLTPRQYRARG